MNGREPVWRVGDSTGIRKEDVNPIGLVQVAKGSQQPILKRNRFIGHYQLDHLCALGWTRRSSAS
jgi:hypothetical protein